MNQAIHKVHKENQKLFSLFTQSRKDLVWMIQCDREWFAGWIPDHPPPPGVELLPNFEENNIDADNPQID